MSSELIAIPKLHLLCRFGWKWWNSGDHEQTRWVNQASSRMQWNIDGPSEFSCIYSVHEDLSLCTRNENILVAWMNIKPCYFPFIDYELGKRCLEQLRSLDIYLWNTDAVRWCGRYDSKCRLERWHSKTAMLTQVHSGTSISRWLIVKWSVVEHVSIWCLRFLVFNDLQLNLQLVWIAESLCVSFDVADEIPAVFDVVAAN